MLSLRQFRQLVMLSEERNFTRAAERLGMTQPSLSRSIADLERSCAMRLFERGRAGVTLTAAGADLVADARHILGQVSAIEHNLSMQSRGMAGRVTLGTGPLAASYLLPRLLSDCLARSPALAITALIDTTGALIEKVLDGRLDFCICAAVRFDPTPALAIQPLGAFRLGYFVRAGHPLADARDPVTWADIAPFPRAAGTTRAHGDPSLRNLFGSLGTTVECDDYEVLRVAMLRTDMIWLASDKVLATELAQGLVKELRPGPNGALLDAEMALIRPAGRSQSAAMAQVVNVAVAIMEDA